MVCGTSDAQPINATKRKEAPAVRRTLLHQATKSAITVSRGQCVVRCALATCFLAAEREIPDSPDDQQDYNHPRCIATGRSRIDLAGERAYFIIGHRRNTVLGRLRIQTEGLEFVHGL